MITTAIDYLKRSSETEPSDMKGFYHPACPLLFAACDTIGSLEDCPFPLKTDSFEVLLYGKTSQDGNGSPGDGRFAVVRYTKSCGHTVEERIAFFENVKDFTHCGKEFIGADYSILNWEKRIAFFQLGRCDICGMYEHCRWAHFHAGERTSPKKKTLERFDILMNYNFGNWKTFVSREKFEADISEKKPKK